MSLDKRPNHQGARCIISLPLVPDQDMQRITMAESAPTNKILVVDDEPLISELVADICEEHELKAVCCSSIQQARALVTESFRAVFLDLTLPDGSGLVLIPELLRQQPHLQNHIIIMTGDPGDVNVRNAIEEHPVELMAKPFRISDINKLLASWA